MFCCTGKPHKCQVPLWLPLFPTRGKASMYVCECQPHRQGPEVPRPHTLSQAAALGLGQAHWLRGSLFPGSGGLLRRPHCQGRGRGRKLSVGTKDTRCHSKRWAPGLQSDSHTPRPGLCTCLPAAATMKLPTGNEWESTREPLTRQCAHLGTGGPVSFSLYQHQSYK